MNRTPAPMPKRDAIEAKLRAVSEAAWMRWSPDDASPHSFSWQMAQFIRENSEADALTVLTAWEAARSTGERRPNLGQLWYTGGKLGRAPAAFRDKALGREEVAATHSAGALSDKGVDNLSEWEAIEARRAAKAVAS